MPNLNRRYFLKSSAAIAAAAALHPQNLFAHRPDLQQKLASDPLRPQFHLLPAKNWMNDPNGPIFWRGQYHMFFQYNPNSAVWGDMHWNHAVSDDMIHWRHLPIALAPTPEGDDADGCFTGSAVDDNGTATIIYTGVKSVAADRATLRDGHHNFRETQLLATSKDPNLLAWEKLPKPVIEPPQDPNLTGFRDPFLFRLDDARPVRAGDGRGRSRPASWLCGVAAGQFKKGGPVPLYESKNLRDWKYLHPLAEGQWSGREHTDPVGSGEMWECPDFFPLDKKWVLLYSTAGSVFWEVGDLDPKELVFHSQTRGILDHGAYSAQKTQLDAKGNRILWGWITEKRPDSELLAAGWAGCMSLPRILTIADDNTLEMRFAHEVESLRGKKATVITLDRIPEHPQASPIKNQQIENLAGELNLGCAHSGALTLNDHSGEWFSLNIKTSDQGSQMVVNGKSIAVQADANGRYDCRLYIDGSVVELICNNRCAITTRVYKKPSGPLKIVADYDFLDIYPIHSISPNRLTT